MDGIVAKGIRVLPERDLQPGREVRRRAPKKAIEALESRAAPVQPGTRGTEYLANERTFLAWIRTSVSVISLGFVVDRFGLFLRELGNAGGARQRMTPAVTSFVVGDLMMAVGGGLAILAAVRFSMVHRDLERGVARADKGMVLAVAVVVVLLAGAMIAIARP